MAKRIPHCTKHLRHVSFYICATNIMYVRLDGLWWQAVDQYTPAGNVHFWSMLSMTLTFKPTKMSLTVTSFIKICPCISGICEEMPTKVLIWPYIVWLWLRPLMFWSQNLMCPQLHQSVNLVKFHKWFVRYHTNKLLVYDHACMDTQTYSPKQNACTTTTKQIGSRYLDNKRLFRDGYKVCCQDTYTDPRMLECLSSWNTLCRINCQHAVDKGFRLYCDCVPFRRWILQPNHILSLAYHRLCFPLVCCNLQKNPKRCCVYCH